MTKRGTKEEPRAAKPLKLKKETVKDLDPRRQGAEVRGGGYKDDTSRCMAGGGSQNGS